MWWRERVWCVCDRGRETETLGERVVISADLSLRRTIITVMLHYFMILLEVVKRTPTPLNLVTYSVKLMSDTYIGRAYHLSQHIVFFPLRDDELQQFYIFFRHYRELCVLISGALW
jgi:hypothetical protein